MVALVCVGLNQHVIVYNGLQPLIFLSMLVGLQQNNIKTFEISLADILKVDFFCAVKTLVLRFSARKS